MFEAGMKVRLIEDIFHYTIDGGRNIVAGKGDVVTLMKRSVHYPKRDWAAFRENGSVIAVKNEWIKPLVLEGENREEV